MARYPRRRLALIIALVSAVAPRAHTPCIDRRWGEAALREQSVVRGAERAGAYRTRRVCQAPLLLLGPVAWTRVGGPSTECNDDISKDPVAPSALIVRKPVFPIAAPPTSRRRRSSRRAAPASGRMKNYKSEKAALSAARTRTDAPRARLGFARMALGGRVALRSPCAVRKQAITARGHFVPLERCIFCLSLPALLSRWVFPCFCRPRCSRGQKGIRQKGRAKGNRFWSKCRARGAVGLFSCAHGHRNCCALYFHRPFLT